MKVESHKFEVESSERLDLLDLTQKVRDLFTGSMVKEGMLYLHSLHTTASWGRGYGGVAASSASSHQFAAL